MVPNESMSPNKAMFGKIIGVQNVKKFFRIEMLGYTNQILGHMNVLRLLSNFNVLLTFTIALFIISMRRASL